MAKSISIYLESSFELFLFIVNPPSNPTNAPTTVLNAGPMISKILSLATRSSNNPANMTATTHITTEDNVNMVTLNIHVIKFVSFMANSHLMHQGIYYLGSGHDAINTQVLPSSMFGLQVITIIYSLVGQEYSEYLFSIILINGF